MRDILFKAKRSDDGEWVEFSSMVQLVDKKREIMAFGVIPCGTLASGSLENLVDVDPETVCQYTGFKDANGDMILEVDVLLGEGPFEYSVVFTDGRFEIKRRSVLYGMLAYEHAWFKVNGNIHDTRGEDNA